MDLFEMIRIARKESYIDIDDLALDRAAISRLETGKKKVHAGADAIEQYIEQIGLDRTVADQLNMYLGRNPSDIGILSAQEIALVRNGRGVKW